MDVSHDELVTSIIRHYRDTSDLTGIEDREIETEAHYNHYGTRGVADIHVLDKNKRHTRGHLFEVKTHLTKAHEIIRQFKRMVRYFYKDEDRSLPSRRVYELAILPTKHNLNHLLANDQLYTTWPDSHRDCLLVTFRSPSNLRPLIVYGENVPAFRTEAWWNYAECANDPVSELLEEVIYNAS